MLVGSTSDMLCMKFFLTWRECGREKGLKVDWRCRGRYGHENRREFNVEEDRSSAVKVKGLKGGSILTGRENLKRQDRARH